MIQGEESKVDLESAETKLKVQEATVDLHKASDTAKIASVTRQRDKAQSEVDLAKERLGQMEMKAPLDGVVIYQMNSSQGWMNRQPFKVGDHIWPGAPLAVIPDLSTIRMEGRLDEVDRGRVAAGAEARVHVDALPEKTLAAKVASVTPLTQVTFGEWPPIRSFHVYAEIESPDERLRPDMNGSMDVITAVSRTPSACRAKRFSRATANRLFMWRRRTAVTGQWKWKSWHATRTKLPCGASSRIVSCRLPSSTWMEGSHEHSSDSNCHGSGRAGTHTGCCYPQAAPPASPHPAIGSCWYWRWRASRGPACVCIDP